ncbi:MAG TPA: TetR/AcrR family transcriptional regulator [Acidimicrobiia bacterium]
MPRIRAASIAEHKALTRDELLDAAEVLFSRHGYEGSSLGDVAAFVGIGRTTVYEYFADKEDLLASLVEGRLPKLVEQVVEGIPQDAPPSKQLSELASRMIEFVATEPTLGVLLHRAVPKLSEGAQARVRAAHEGLAREFARVYRKGVQAGELRSMPPDLAGRLMQDLIMSAARVLNDDRDPSRRLEEVVNASVAVLLEGFTL